MKINKIIVALAIATSTCFTTFEVKAQEQPMDETPKIAPMHEGQVAPFEGILFSTRAAAMMYVNEKACEEKTDIEVERAKQSSAVLCEANLTKQKIQCETDKKVSAAEAENLRRQNEHLKKEVAKRSAERKALWLSVGAGGGILSSVLVAVLVKSL
jgi:hypothetical protein